LTRVTGAGNCARNGSVEANVASNNMRNAAGLRIRLNGFCSTVAPHLLRTAAMLLQMAFVRQMLSVSQCACPNGSDDAKGESVPQNETAGGMCDSPNYARRHNNGK
jgi:hypothetical protein